MKYAILCIGILVAISSYLFIEYTKVSRNYEISLENLKAYSQEASALKDESRVFKFTVSQLEYLNDSLIQKMNNVRKELKIKDSRIEQLQYQLKEVIKEDTLYLSDTVFVENINIDTIIGDKWVNTRLYLEYPNKIVITPKVITEQFCFVQLKKETVNPPKKFFLFRWFQKKHYVSIITVKENNPYVEEKESRYIQIIK